MSERRSTPLAAVLTLALLAPSLAPAPLAAQPAPEQTVWLKNGGFVRGALVELVPGDHVTLQLVTGEIRRILTTDIDRLGASPAPPSSGPPLSTPPAATPPAAPPASGLVANVPSPLASARPEQALVRVTAPPQIELQVRPRLERGPWTTVCLAPCDRSLVVIDREFRAAGANVYPSHTFLIEPNDRPVRIEVNPGSATSHRWGVIGILAGTPLFLLGGTGFGLGRVQGQDALATTGLVAAIAGGALLLTALPLLFTGQTRVRSDRGVQIGQRPPAAHF